MANGWHLFDDGERQIRVAIANDGAKTWVFVNGNTYTIDNEARGKARVKSARAHDVMAPMPATVVSINAAVGQAVNEGDTLIVLEAMKMELPIKAPASGTVAAIRCAKGELVQPGVNLIELA